VSNAFRTITKPLSARRFAEGLAPILLKSRKPNNTEKLGES
jgi:hypothetical protein